MPSFWQSSLNCCTASCRWGPACSAGALDCQSSSALSSCAERSSSEGPAHCHAVNWVFAAGCAACSSAGGVGVVKLEKRLLRSKRQTGGSLESATGRPRIPYLVLAHTFSATRSSCLASPSSVTLIAGCWPADQHRPESSHLPVAAAFAQNLQSGPSDGLFNTVAAAVLTG